MPARGSPRRGERGAFGVAIAAALAIFILFFLLVLNMGRVYMVRGQLQNASDAAALAAARDLDGTPAGLAAAIARAPDYGARHFTESNTPVNILASDVILGNWDFNAPKAQAFTPIAGRANADARNINAVLTRGRRDQTGGNPLAFYGSAFTGRATTNVGAEAVAVGGGPCNGCTIPIAVPDCVVVVNNQLQCGLVLVLTDDPSDNAGFTNLTPNPAGGTSAYIDILNNLGNASTCTNIDAGDPIYIKNGGNLNNNVVAAFRPLVGSVVLAPIVSLSCPNPKFNQDATVVGFASFTLVAVHATGEHNPACAIPGKQGQPGACIIISVECDYVQPKPSPSGCGFYGTLSPRVRLVR
jgi:Flp pilus assembly protein TadG